MERMDHEASALGAPVQKLRQMYATPSCTTQLQVEGADERPRQPACLEFQAAGEAGAHVPLYHQATLTVTSNAFKPTDRGPGIYFVMERTMG
mmetsp:Transcript_45939/g.114992  ORF Transcript_45939/g.114992 Transcript_45939/m.114992 type:complete len:92 (-) Transcript_45939:986-1261(-)